MRVSVIQMLPSAEVDDLPVVVKFILQSVGDSDAFEVQKPETIRVRNLGLITKIVTVKINGFDMMHYLINITPFKSDQFNNLTSDPFQGCN